MLETSYLFFELPVTEKKTEKKKEEPKKEEPSSIFQRKRVDMLLTDLMRKFPQQVPVFPPNPVQNAGPSGKYPYLCLPFNYYTGDYPGTIQGNLIMSIYFSRKK